MGLIGELYVFDGAAPTHDDVWRILCETVRREVPRQEISAPDEGEAADWKAAEKRGCLLLTGKSTSFHDVNKRSISIYTLIRGDQIFASGNGHSLLAALTRAMIQLGGRVAPSKRHRVK